MLQRVVKPFPHNRQCLLLLSDTHSSMFTMSLEDITLMDVPSFPIEAEATESRRFILCESPPFCKLLRVMDRGQLQRVSHSHLAFLRIPFSLFSTFVYFQKWITVVQHICYICGKAMPKGNLATENCSLVGWG